MDFKEGIKLDVSPFVRTIGEADYLPWAIAVAMAGRPRLEVKCFNGKPYLDMFGGAIVATEQAIESAGLVQETWMPVLDEEWNPIPIERIDAMAIHQQLMRTKAKSIAMINGVGLSLYCGLGGNGLAFAKKLGLTPESDLSQVKPMEACKGDVSYIPWPAALAAARLTDPQFVWRVNFGEAVDWYTGKVKALPVMSLNRGYMVSVSVRYKGREHTEYLPIMGEAPDRANFQTLDKPTVFDWNTAVMRALTKAIAVVSGYGLGTYADEDIEKIVRSAQNIPKPKAKTTPEVSGSDPSSDAAEQALIAELEGLLPKDAAKRDRIFRACQVRGMVKEVPQTAEDLVRMSHEAAKRVIAGLRVRQQPAN